MKQASETSQQALNDTVQVIAAAKHAGRGWLHGRGADRGMATRDHISASNMPALNEQGEGAPGVSPQCPSPWGRRRA